MKLKLGQKQCVKISDIWSRETNVWTVYVYCLCITVWTWHLTICTNDNKLWVRGRRGRDRMVVGFTTTYAISAYHHLWVQILLRWCILNTTLCDKVCQWLAAGQWFSLGTPVSSTNKTDCHDIVEILLKVT
jgi:hypothetical protein